MIKFPLEFSKGCGLKVLEESSETYSNDYCKWPPHIIVSVEASTFTV